jgi:hypothetical protein
MLEGSYCFSIASLCDMAKSSCKWIRVTFVLFLIEPLSRRQDPDVSAFVLIFIIEDEAIIPSETSKKDAIVCPMV